MKTTPRPKSKKPKRYLLHSHQIRAQEQRWFAEGGLFLQEALTAFSNLCDESAKRAKDIASWDDVRCQSELDTIDDQFREAGFILICTARKSIQAIDVVKSQCVELLRILETLVTNKRDNAILGAIPNTQCENAADALSQVIYDGCTIITKIATSYPRLFQPTARKQDTWPVLVSRRMRLPDEISSLLRQIELSDSTPLNTNAPEARWKRDNAFLIAYSLYLHVKKHNRKASTLPAFNKNSSKDWWKLAQVDFLKSYPTPDTDPELASLLSSSERSKPPSKQRARIVALLKRRFLNLAKYPPGI